LHFDRARSNVERSEAKYRDLVENIEDIIAILDLEGNILDVNRAAMTILGYNHQNGAGVNVRSIMPPRFRDGFDGFLDEVRSSGRSSGLMRILTSLGDERLVEYQTTLQSESVEEPVIHAVARDVTEKWRAERQLKRYSARLDAQRRIDRAVLAGSRVEEIADIAVDSIRELVPCDRASVVVFTENTELARILAVNEDGRVGPGPNLIRPASDLFDLDQLRSNTAFVIPDLFERKNLVPAMQQLMSHGIRCILTVPLLVGDMLLGSLNLGSRIENAFSAEEIDVARQLGDELSLALKQGRLMSALDSARERLGAIVEHLPEGVLLADKEGRVLLANSVARGVLDLLGVPAGDRLPESLGDVARAKLLQPEAFGPVELVDGSESPRYFEVLTREVGTGAEKAWVVVLRDVTADREAKRQQQLQQRLAAVGQLAAGIAHDFNNILQAVELNAELIGHGLEGEKIARRVGAIHEQADRGAALIRQILDFARKSVTHPHTMSLQPFIRESIRLLERGIPEDIQVMVELNNSNLLVNADPGQMQQLLTNLVMNARDAMPDGGVLSIDVDELEVCEGDDRPFPSMLDGPWVRLRVRDTGHGIPEALRDRIFEPFFTTKEPGQGTGLGLAQVYGIVKQHGGFVAVGSGDVGGSTFSVFLPLVTESGAVRPWVDETFPAEIPLGNGQLVLVAEDDPAVLDTAQAGLEALGYQVVTASDGAQAIELCDQHRESLQLVISDVVMPGIGGVELAHQLRESGFGARVLLMSGYPLEGRRGDDSVAQVADWLQKPFTMAELARAVAAALPASST
jgi:PAS domain S-box-containing protein